MVAVCIIGLMVILGIVVDYGVIMASRAQAQNAADAAALAGAYARVNVDASNPPASNTSGPIYQRVTAVAAQNAIWGVSPPASSVTLGWNCPPGGGTTNCVVVDVFRDGTHGSSTLPTSFLGLVNMDEQHIRAHAVADTTGANATDCIRPWFLPDYGYQVPADLGREVTFHNYTSPSGYGQLDVGSGGSAIREAIKYCASGTYSIGQVVETKPGGTAGPERQGIDAVLDWDPAAEWDDDTKTVVNSCADTNSCSCDGAPCPNGGRVSPRIAIVPICSPSEADCVAGGPNDGTITITNFLSFFIVRREGNGNELHIVAQLVGTAGMTVSGASPAPNNAAFLKVIRLIR